MNIKKLIEDAHEKYQKLGYRFGRYSIRQGLKDGVEDAKERYEDGERVLFQVPHKAKSGWNGTPISSTKVDNPSNLTCEQYTKKLK